MLKVALFGAVMGSRSALPVLCHPQIALTVFGLDSGRSARHADYHDLAAEARSLGVMAHSVSHINDESTLAMLRALQPDIICVFGWSQLAGAAFRAIPRLGVLGWHPSLLPENRGRAVIPWTILQRRTETGFTIFWIDEGMDSGDIAGQEVIPLSPRESSASLYAKFEEPTKRVLAGVRDALLEGRMPRTPQDHRHATYCALRTPADGQIDWTQTADEIDCLIRAAGAPYVGAFTFLRGERLTILDAVPLETASFWGLPGQVQWIDASGAVVHCGGRTNLAVRSVRTGTGEVCGLEQIVRMHERLGTDGSTGGNL